MRRPPLRLAVYGPSPLAPARAIQCMPYARHMLPPRSVVPPAAMRGECKLRLRLGESVGTQSRRRCGRGEPSPGADVAGVSPVPGSGADVAAVRRGEAYNSSSRRANACNRHAVRDTMPCGMSCRVEYLAVWDTMLYGIPCSGDGRHSAQCDATAVLRPDVRGWARTDGRRPSANRISYSVASRTCEWRALNEGATESSLGVPVRACTCVRACVRACACVCCVVM